MTNTTLIKIGDSTGIIIPAKELKRAGLRPGDLVDYDWRPSKPTSAVDEHSAEIVALTQKLIARHRKALEHLAQR